MKRLFVTIISISLSLSILLMSVSAFDTPYKELSRRERAELPVFQSFEVYLSTNIPLDITEYEGEGPFDLNGVRVKSVEFSFDATDIGIELYDYKVLVDEASYNSVYEAKEIWVENESVIGVVTFSTYGNGDINADGEHDQYDYILSKRIYFETYEANDLELGYADIDNDGEITARDYILSKGAYFGTMNPWSVAD